MSFIADTSSRIQSVHYFTTGCLIVAPYLNISRWITINSTTSLSSLVHRNDQLLDHEWNIFAQAKMNWWWWRNITFNMWCLLHSILGPNLVSKREEFSLISRSNKRKMIMSKSFWELNWEWPLDKKLFFYALAISLFIVVLLRIISESPALINSNDYIWQPVVRTTGIAVSTLRTRGRQ